MIVKVDKEVLAATVVALEDLAADVPALFSRAAGLGAGTEMAGLDGLVPWAQDTSRDLRARIGVLESMAQSSPSFGGVRMDAGHALQVAGQSMTVEDALVALHAAQPNADAWEQDDPANLSEWFKQLQAEALDKLARLDDAEQAEILVEAFYGLRNVVAGSSAAVTTAAYLFTQGGPALANWLVRHNVVDPRLDDLARTRPTIANWLRAALEAADDKYLRGQTQFRYPGAFIPNMTQGALLRLAGVTENFDDWVQRTSTATQRYAVNGVHKHTLLARFLQSRSGTQATAWVQNILSTTSTGHLAQRLAQWGGTAFGRPWTNPATGVTYGRGAGNLITMARVSGLSTMASNAGALRVLGVAGSGFATVDGVVGLANNHDEHVRLWNEGGTEGRAHVIGEYAETAFNASMTAALIAPNPFTIGAVAITGVVWVGAKVVEHWDDITAAAGDAAAWVGDRAEDTAEWVGDRAEDTVEWAGDRAEDAAEWAGDRLDDIKESKINPMNWW